MRGDGALNDFLKPRREMAAPQRNDNPVSDAVSDRLAEHEAHKAKRAEELLKEMQNRARMGTMGMDNNPVVRGPACNIMPYRPDAQLDVSFRALVDYHIGTDTHLARLDVLVNGVQLNVAFHLSRVMPDAGRPGALRMPKHLDGFSSMVNSEDLIAGLRGMADRLEQELVAQAVVKAEATK